MEQFLSDTIFQITPSQISPYLSNGGNSRVIMDPHIDGLILCVGSKRRYNKIELEDLKEIFISSKGKLLNSNSKFKLAIDKFLLNNNFNIRNILNKDIKEPNITYGEFWDYQVKLISDQLKNKESNLNNKKELISFIDYTDILNYFKSFNKDKEFNQFINSIPNGKIRHSFNELIRLLRDLINDKEEVKGNIRGIYYDLSKEDKIKWKLDMIKYISSLSNLEDLNETNIYKEDILKDKSFLNTLFSIDEEGIGRGEILLSYLFKDVKISGGGESYDLSIGDNKLEVKDYSTNCYEMIRLGTGGKLTRFKFWKNIQETIHIAKQIEENYGDYLKTIISPYFYKLWMNLIDDNPNNSRAIAVGVESGEFANVKLDLLRTWYYLAHELVQKNIHIDNENFTTAILKGPGLTSKIISIKPISDIGNKIEIDSNSKVNEIINELTSIVYVKNPDLLQEDLDNVPKKYFEDHNGLNYFIVFRPNKVYIVDQTGFVFGRITQASIKIVEKDFAKENNIGKKSFIKWKQEINKIKELSKEDYKNLISNISFEKIFSEEIINNG